MDRRGADLLSDVLPFGRLWYGKPHAVTYAINYAKVSQPQKLPDLIE